MLIEEKVAPNGLFRLISIRKALIPKTFCNLNFVGNAEHITSGCFKLHTCLLKGTKLSGNERDNILVIGLKCYPWESLKCLRY